MNLKNKIEKAIENNDFTTLERLVEKLSFNDLRNNLIEVAFNNKSMVLYSLVCILLTKNETTDLHYLAAEILSLPLCHFEGAYAAALFHTRKAIELDPNDTSLKEFLLFFHGVPDRLITNLEARSIIAEILESDSNNKTAKALLKRLNKKPLR